MAVHVCVLSEARMPRNPRRSQSGVQTELTDSLLELCKFYVPKIGAA